MKKGIFITLEGGEGTGKSTQIRLLHQALSASGVDALMSREPGGTPQAERIRALLLQHDSGTFDPMTEALLFFAARREHLVNKIWPAIKKGQWVLSDRFADSSRAFQGYGMGLDMRVIESLYRMVAGEFQPDLTFIFDLDPETGIRRSMKHMQHTQLTLFQEDRYERIGLPFHQRLRKGFLEIAGKFPERCVVIDAAQDVRSVHQRMLEEIFSRFGVIGKEARHG
ncbi:MAG: dTMP kinase [Pseudomonadota bacterium]